MSDIEFDCPECGGALVIDAAGAGLTVNCNLCSKPIHVPNPEDKPNEIGVTFSCPHCQQHIEVPEELFGNTVNCPTCQKSIQVPQSASALVPQPASAHASPPITPASPPLPRLSDQATPSPVTQASQTTWAPRRKSLVGSVRCALTSHNWNGCTCWRCGRTSHQWSPDHDGCLRCGQVIGISSLADLRAIDRDLAGHYRLLTDIDALGKTFAPIGHWGEVIRYFTGVLDGGGHTIHNLFIQPSGWSGNSSNMGLFSIINEPAHIHDLTLSVTVSGGFRVGGLVGWSWKATIARCVCSGTVTGTYDVGGLVGEQLGGNIVDCRSTCKVTGANRVGGLVGYAGCDVIRCQSDAVCDWSGVFDSTFRDNGMIGGLAGCLGKYNMQSCTASGKVSGLVCGGLTAYNELGTIVDCRSNCTGKGEHFAGDLVAINFGRVSDCIACRAISGPRYDRYSNILRNHLARIRTEAHLPTLKILDELESRFSENAPAIGAMVEQTLSDRKLHTKTIGGGGIRTFLLVSAVPCDSVSSAEFFRREYPPGYTGYMDFWLNSTPLKMAREMGHDVFAHVLIYADAAAKAATLSKETLSIGVGILPLDTTRRESMPLAIMPIEALTPAERTSLGS